MALETPQFVHDVPAGSIRYGRGCIENLESVLADHGVENALVVCGSNVGANRTLMDRIENGGGERLAAVFDETTPGKEIETAYDGVEQMRNLDVDALVPVGGGSSLDVATTMCALEADYRPLEVVIDEFRERGRIPVSDADTVPRFPVPTTLAGADVSAGAGIMLPVDEERVGTVLGSDALAPATLLYDPDLFETTPTDVLAASAMNGFDKGLEAIYSSESMPLGDATAVRGLRYLRTGLPRLRDPDREPSTMDRIVVGTILVQYGTSMTTSLIHAFGHALRRHAGVQQGLAHAVVAPAAVRFIFERVDGRRDLLAEGLAPSSSADPAMAVVEAITDVRNGLELPSRLRDLEGLSAADCRPVAELARDDPLMANLPDGLNPSVGALEEVLTDVW